MKYTKYLMNENFIKMNSFDTDNILLKVPLRLVSIPVAFVGIATVLGFLPMAIVVDEYRNTKYYLIYFKKHHNNRNFFNYFSYNYLWKSLISMMVAEKMLAIKVKRAIVLYVR
jgi:hypothetical protein